MRRSEGAPLKGALCLIVSAVLALSGCGLGREEPVPEPPARIIDGEFRVRTGDGDYEKLYLSGVNIGAGKPGYFPGEFGVTREDYLRWFREISDMNVRVIRVYVNQMPEFYDALKKFNDSAERPLYLIHGVYMNEDYIQQYQDAFDPDGAIVDSFTYDLKNAVDMIHGNASVEKRPGNAGGEYTSDVSEWVIGWILGVEWSADFVLGTNEAHPEKTEFSGEYVYTENASPFEVFLAQSAETVIGWEMESYGAQRPTALCNWCTTDPLDHPNEPSPEMEDAVSVDAEHILASESFTAGFFASYHVYPYYPEFLSYDRQYLTGDEPDPYLAYLKALNAHHTMPVLISEYGIPASRGTAHSNAVTGMSQGHVSEERQGQWLTELDADIREAGCAGGLIFTWQDEWFKRTWNSMDYEDPDRRPFWFNCQSPEESFGLLAFDQGARETAVVLDGDPGEWRRRDHLTENQGIELSVRSDAAFVYLLLRSDLADFENDVIYVPLDVMPEQGNTSYGDAAFESGADFLLRLHGREDTAVLVDAYYDVFQFDYSVKHQFFQTTQGQLEKDSGCFNRIYLAMNRGMTIPGTGETVPFERFDTGALRYGNGDPESGDYDSLADFCLGEGCVEIRLPWMLLGFMDPSRLEVMGDFNSSGAIEGASTPGIYMGVCAGDGSASAPMELYSWDGWDIPETHERLKESYYIMQEYFEKNG